MADDTDASMEAANTEKPAGTIPGPSAGSSTASTQSTTAARQG